VTFMLETGEGRVSIRAGRERRVGVAAEKTAKKGKHRNLAGPKRIEQNQDVRPVGKKGRKGGEKLRG